MHTCYVSGVNQKRTTGSVQSYLEALPNVGALGTVVTSLDLQACSETGTNGAAWTVEFKQNFGNLPLLVSTSKHLTSSLTTPITVQKVTAGILIMTLLLFNL